MLDNNSKANSKNPKLLPLLTEIATIIFSLIGLICLCILMFNVQTSSYTKIFQPSIIANCNSSAGLYLRKYETVETLVTVLDGVGIGGFGFLLLGAVVGVLRGGGMGAMARGVWFVFRVVTIYWLVVATGCLLGNCIKTNLSTKQVYSCTTSSQTIKNFYNSSQTLSLLSGISLFSAIGLFFINPILKRSPKSQQYQDKQKQKQKEEEKEKEKEKGPLEEQNTYHSLNNLISTDKKPESMEIKISVQGSQRAKERSTTGHKPRIFGRAFLTQSRYGISPRRDKDKEEQIHGTAKSHKIYDIDSSLVESGKGKPIKAPIMLDLGFASGLQSEKKSSTSLKQYTINGYKMKSHILEVVDGPPVQLGEYSPEKHRNH